VTDRTRSVSKKREERRENDYYPTDPRLCTAMCQRLSRLHPKAILEPGAGAGNFVRACKAQWFDAPVTAVEIVGGNEQALSDAGATHVWTSDFLEDNQCFTGEPHWGKHRYDLIIGNPPYSLVEAFVQRSIMLLDPYDSILALVLKFHFFGSRKRVDLLARFPHYAAFPIVPRPDFTGEGRDTAEYVMVTWHMLNGVLDAKQWLLADKPIIWR
jgi:hypothetical protein